MDIFVIFAVKSEDNRPIFIMKITDNIIIYEALRQLGFPGLE